MKLWKNYVIFAYILQGKMGKTEKTRKKITQLKWPKYQKPKYGMHIALYLYVMKHFDVHDFNRQERFVSLIIQLRSYSEICTLEPYHKF